jgi:hypothetical protein
MRMFGGVSAGREALLLVCLGAGLLLTGGLVGAQEPPVADAGLDQSVERNTTVYLDAGGSYGPDAEVTDYRWSVAAPNGTVFEPDCGTCERTRFRATQLGQYNVTVTVTDVTGAQASDTVHVTVEEANPPDLQLTGPTSLFVGADGPVKADVAAGDDPVSRLDWSTDGTDAGGAQLTSEEPSERRFSFSEAGTHTVTAVVTDVLGRTTTDTHTIDVIGPTAPSGPGTQRTGGGGGGGGDSSDADTDFVAASAETVRTYSDLAFINYADGNSAITLANTAGPGDLTIVDEETARDYLKSYNWHNVNLGELVEDGLVNQDKANKILERSKENINKTGNGAVGGINPYEPTNTQEETSPVDSQPTAIGPVPTESTTATDPIDTSDATGPQSSKTVTLTQGSTNTESGSDTTNSESSAPKPSETVTITSGSGLTGLDVETPSSSDSSNSDPNPSNKNSNSNDEVNISSDSADNSESIGSEDSGNSRRGNDSGTVTFF